MISTSNAEAFHLLNQQSCLALTPHMQDTTFCDEDANDPVYTTRDERHSIVN